MIDGCVKQQSPFWRGHTALIVGILVASATLKFQRLHLGPLFGSSLIESRHAVLVIANLEGLVAVWLVSRVARRTAWWFTLALFLGFTAVAGYKVVNGDESCGCFGDAAVPPWIMVVADSAVVLSICLRLCNTSGPVSPLSSSGRILLVTLLIMGTVGMNQRLWRYDSPDREDPPGLVIGPRTGVLVPEEWEGHRLPILDWISCGEEIRKGTWQLVVVSSACPNCVARLSGFKAHSENIAFVIIDAGGVSAFRRHVKPDWNVLICSMSSDRRWYSRVPVEVELVDGVTRSVTFT